MAPDSELRGRIEVLLRRMLPLRTDLPEDELKRRLAAWTEKIAEFEAKVAEGFEFYQTDQTPCFGFAEARSAEGLNAPWPQPFGRGTFGEAREGWVKPDREHALRKVGRTKTEEELQALIDAKKAVITALERLHSPAILALINQGILIGRELERKATEVKKIEDALASLGRIPKEQGRGPESIKQAGQKFALILAEAYFDLTGKPPERSKDRSFQALVHTMFKAIELGRASDDMMKSSPPTSPATMHLATTRSNTCRRMPLSRKRSLRAREKAG